MTGVQTCALPIYIAEGKAKDPIILFETYLKDCGVADDALLEQMNKKIMDTVNEATDYAENAAYAPPEHALRFVYAEGEDA